MTPQRCGTSGISVGWINNPTLIPEVLPWSVVVVTGGDTPIDQGGGDTPIIGGGDTPIASLRRIPEPVFLPTKNIARQPKVRKFSISHLPLK